MLVLANRVYLQITFPNLLFWSEKIATTISETSRVLIFWASVFKPGDFGFDGKPILDRIQTANIVEEKLAFRRLWYRAIKEVLSLEGLIFVGEDSPKMWALVNDCRR